MMTEFQDRRAAAAAIAADAPPVPATAAELDAAKKRRLAVEAAPVQPSLAVAPNSAHILTAHERDIANAAFAATLPAPKPDADVPGPRFKVGQRVTIKSSRRKGSIPAVVTKASAVAGKKQELVECKTADGSVQEYWSDEIE